MNVKFLTKAVTSAMFVLVPSLAFSHSGIGHADGFMQGLAHPFSGLDHILAMVTVGVFAFQLGGRAMWLVPASFVSVMTLAAMLGPIGIDLLIIEMAIALSCVALGALIAIGWAAPLTTAMVLAGSFAFFHGYAHAVEMPETANLAIYGSGFVVGTVLLHMAGIGIGGALVRLAHSHGKASIQWLGGLVSLTGIWVLLSH